METETVNLDALDGFGFERVCERLFERAGWGKVTRVGGVADGGRDLIIDTRDGRKLIVECKLYGDTVVGRPVIQKLHSAVISSNADGGLVVTTGRFSGAAREYAAGITGITMELLDMDGLARLAHSAGIDLESDSHRRTYTYPVLERPMMESALLAHLRELKSSPADAADLMGISWSRTTLHSMHWVSASARQTFRTSIGVIHEVDAEDSFMFNSRGEYDADATSFFGAPEVDARVLRGERPERHFAMDDADVRNLAVDMMSNRYSANIRYRGRNGNEYRKDCELGRRNIHVDSVRRVYMPVYRVTLQVYNMEYHCNMLHNGRETRVSDMDWLKCSYCDRAADTLCNDCGRVVHTSHTGSHGFKCSDCGKTVCVSCATTERRLMVLRRHRCRDCGPVV